MSKVWVKFCWNLAGGIGIIGLMIGIIVPLVILFGQTSTYLKTGVWPAVPVSDVFDHFGVAYPQTSWLGVQQIINSFLEWPLSLFVFSTGLITVCVCGLIAGRYEELTNKAQSRG